jgi:hypothetical protein
MHVLSEEEMAKINDPQWCADHPYHCKKLKAKVEAAEHGGPPHGRDQGPPPEHE